MEKTLPDPQIKFPPSVFDRWPADVLDAIVRALGECSCKARSIWVESCGGGDNYYLVLVIKLPTTPHFAYTFHLTEMELRESVTPYGFERLKSILQKGIDALLVCGEL